MNKDFYHIPIPDDIFEKMQGVSYKENPHISRDDLRYVSALYWGFDCKIHQGEMIVNTKIADAVVAILQELYNNEYQLERVELIDVYGGDDDKSMAANNSSAFNYRNIVGTDKLSNHALGMAVDINPLYNPYLRCGKDGSMICDPPAAIDYIDRDKCFDHKIDHCDLAYNLFTKYGFSWGGDWVDYKDYQHFEYQ